MLILMKQHGRMIVCCVIAALTFGIAFGMRADGYQGFVQIAYGKAMEDMTEETAGRADAQAAQAVAARRKPEIAYTYQKTLSGENVSLNSMFSATDADGNPAAVNITDVLDASGKSLLYQTEYDKKRERALQNTENFQFPLPGVYRLYVRAADHEKKASCGQYQIPVTSN